MAPLVAFQHLHALHLQEYLDECFSVEDSTLEEIRALAASGASADDVADQIHKKARIGPELIKYIAKTKITS